KTKERRREWVALAPVGESRPVDLVIREGVVTYHRNPPGSAFELDVIGPTELRIFSRPAPARPIPAVALWSS
ncbi:MAG: hypothetical protein AAFY88_30770, partial [Acidobacteriota bacterium]